MATYRQQFAHLLLANDAAMRALFAGLFAQWQALLLAAASADGTIPPERQEAVRRQIEAALTALFLARSTYGDFAAFEVAPNGVTPLAPFMQTLYPTLRRAMTLAVDEQATALRRRLPAAAEQQLRRATINPRTAPLSAFFAVYRPPWLTPRADNRLLNERIAIAAVETRRKTGLLLRELFAERQPARAIADTLQRYFTVGLRRLNKPYGTTGLAHAAPIWRSEPVFAHAVASRASAALNPFAAEVDVVRSRAEPCPICDPIADGSPYAIDTVPLPGYHANCVCRLRYRYGGGKTAAGQLVEGPLADVRGPLHPGFIDLLIQS